MRLIRRLATLTDGTTTMTNKTVTQEYLMGIHDARQLFLRYGAEDAHEYLDSINLTLKAFSASSPVGRMLRGERDFWRNQIKTTKA